MSLDDKTCKFCKKIFSSKQMANLHMKKKVCEKRAKLFCPKCNKKFKNKRDFLRHAKNKKNCLLKTCRDVANDAVTKMNNLSNTVNLNSERDSSFCEELLTIVSKKKPQNGTNLLKSDKNGTFLLNDHKPSTNKVSKTIEINDTSSNDNSNTIVDFFKTIDYSSMSSQLRSNKKLNDNYNDKSSLNSKKKKTKKNKNQGIKQKIVNVPIQPHTSFNVPINAERDIKQPPEFCCNFCGKKFKKKYNKNRHEKKYCKFTVSKIQELEDKIKNL